METIKNYVTSDIGASKSLVTLELFIGDVDGKMIGMAASDDTFIDEGTIDAEKAVIAINGLVRALEQRDAEIERVRAKNERLAAAAKTVMEWWDEGIPHRAEPEFVTEMRNALRGDEQEAPDGKND